LEIGDEQLSVSVDEESEETAQFPLVDETNPTAAATTEEPGTFDEYDLQVPPLIKEP
jgi:hypothetical protein